MFPKMYMSQAGPSAQPSGHGLARSSTILSPQKVSLVQDVCHRDATHRYLRLSLLDAREGGSSMRKREKPVGRFRRR